MTKKYKIEIKLGLFVFINIIFSAIFINKGWPMGAGNVLIGPYIYGFLIGIFCLNDNKKQLLKSLLLGLSFLIIFLISSFGMLYISKTIFGTGDYLPFLSTPIAVLLIIIVINRFKKLENKFLVGSTMIILGLSSTFIGDYFSRIQIILIADIFLNVFFLWQTTTGIILILGLEKNRNKKSP